MNLSELRPCDHCGKHVAPIFFRLTVEQHVINQNAVREYAGLATMFGSAPLADVFGSYGNRATEPASKAELLLCTACFCSDHGVAVAWETRLKAEDARETRLKAEARPGGGE